MSSLIATIPSTFQLWFTLTVIVVVLIVLAIDKGPPHHVMLGAVIILWNVEIFGYTGRPILTVTEALAGFSNTSMITVGGLFVAVAAMEKSRIVHRMAFYVLGQKSGQLWASLKLQVFAFIISAFTNNIPMQALLLPIVCDWCRSRGFPSSKFLLSQNYANIGGGLLATIGTSTNLVVNGLLTSAKEQPFGFFEPAYIALPIGVISIFWMLLMHRFLPDNSEVFLKSVRDRADDLVTAFELSPHSRYVGRPIPEVLSKFGLPRGDLLKVWRRAGAGDGTATGTSYASQPTEERALIAEEKPVAMSWKGWFSAFFTGRERAEHYRLTNTGALSLGFDKLASPEEVSAAGLVEITDVSDSEVAQAGDTFLFTLRPEILTEAVSDSKRHLLVASLPAVKRINARCDIVELVLGVHTPLVNVPIGRGADSLEKLYDIGLIAVRREELQAKSPEEGQEELAPTQIDLESKGEAKVFRAGDKILAFVPVKTEVPKDDFLSVTPVCELRPALTFYTIFPVLLFIAGVTWASIEDTAMVRVSVGMFCFMVLGGWVYSDDIRNVMEWDLLILIASSIALGTALSNSGLANAISILVRAAGLGPQGALFLLVLAVVILNEIVTNNAAATLGIPLAIALTRQLGLKSVRPFAMAVLIGGSAAYACPIGYATHMMVMGPGNYTFLDFLKFGTMLDIIYIAGVTLLLPLIFPLELK